MNLRMLILLAVLVLSLSTIPAVHASSATLFQSFNYQGRFLGPDQSTPINDTVDLVLGIYSVDGTCLLYEEKQTVDLSLTQGYFSVQVGSAPGDAKRTLRDPGKALYQIFSNGSPIRADDSGGARTCLGGFSPGSGEARVLRVSVQFQSGGASETLTPDLLITSGPQAAVAETLQGKTPDEFLQVQGTVTQENLVLLTGGVSSNASTLHHHDGQYAKLANSSTVTLGAGQVLGLGLSNGDPGTHRKGDTWFDTADNTVKYWNGTTAVAVGSGSGATSTAQLTDWAAATAGFLTGSSSLAASKVSGRLSAANLPAGTALNHGFPLSAQNGGDPVFQAVDLSSNAVSGTVGIDHGGTGATTAGAALNALLPSQTGNSGKFLKTDGTNAVWDTAVLPYVLGGTFQGTFTGLQILMLHPFPMNVTIPAGCTNSRFEFNTAATASTTISLQRCTGVGFSVCTQFGTAVVAAGGKVASFSCASATSFTAGADSLMLIGPATADSTASNAGWAIYGIR